MITTCNSGFSHMRCCTVIIRAVNCYMLLLYIELSISFLTDWKRTVNCWNLSTGLWRHLAADYTIIMSRTLNVIRLSVWLWLIAPTLYLNLDSIITTMTAYIRDNIVPAQRQFLKHLVPIVCNGETPSQIKGEGLRREGMWFLNAWWWMEFQSNFSLHCTGKSHLIFKLFWISQKTSLQRSWTPLSRWIANVFPEIEANSGRFLSFLVAVKSTATRSIEK